MINAGTRWVTKSSHPRFIHSSTCSYFQAYPGLYLCLERTGRVWVPTMTKTGPNDVRCVDWPIGMYLFFCNRFLCILTFFFSLFRLYLPHNSTAKVGLCCDDLNGPKRLQMCRLAHRHVFIFLQPFFMHTNIFLYFI
jgi:hypothetical protein